MAHKVDKLAKLLGIRRGVEEKDLESGLEMAQLLEKLLGVRLWVALDEVLKLREVRPELVIVDAHRQHRLGPGRPTPRCSLERASNANSDSCSVCQSHGRWIQSTRH
jgi:hypothetical protein